MKKAKRIVKWTALAIAVALFACFQFAYWTSTSDYQQLAAEEGERMKAYLYADYGGPEVLRLAEIAKPTPKDNQVLIRVRAVSVNPYDWHFMRGEPRVMRIGAGLRKPKSSRVGVDLAGVIEAVGKDVTQFKLGDEVFGGVGGAFAEYVCSAEQRIARKPANISFEQAAGVTVAGVTALQALRDHGQVTAGTKVLINGASGGVGTFAVQLAKVLRAEVSGVCSTRNVELVRSLGADHVIDYTKQDFAKEAGRYDAIIDLVGNRSLAECRRALTANGRYVMVGGPSGKWVAPMGRAIKAAVMSWLVKQKMSMMLTNSTQADLTYLRDLMQDGKVTPVLDRTYKFAELPEAIAYLETGRARGKVVVTVGHQQSVATR